MAEVKEIIFRIRPKTKEAEAALRKMAKDTANFEQVLDKTGKKTDLVGSALKKIGPIAAGAFSVNAIIAFGRHLQDSAVQIEAYERRARTVFGKANKLIDDYAKNTALRLGLTENEFRGQAAAIGDLLVPLGISRKRSAELAAETLKLSAALKQFSGDQRTVAQVSEVVTKGFLGETEGLKSLGISIRKDTEEFSSLVAQKISDEGATKLQAEALATYELITRKASDATRSFENDVDSLSRIQAEAAAIQRQLSDETAKLLTPAFNESAKVQLTTARILNSETIPVWDKLLGFLNPIRLAQNAVTASLEQLTIQNKELSEVVDDSTGNIAENIVTIESMEAEIKKLKSELQITNIDSKRFSDLQSEIKEKEEALNKVLGKNTEELNKRKEAIKELERTNKQFREQVFKDVKLAEEKQEDLLVSLITDDLARQETQLEIKAEREKKAIDESLASDEQKASLKLLIEQNLAKDIAELRLQTQQDEDERRKKEKEDEDKAQQERIDKEKEAADKIREIRRKQSEDVLRFTINSINKALDFQTKAIEMEIDAQQVRVNTAAELAKEGNVKQLKLEEERLQDLQEKRRKALEAERAIAALEIAINTALTISNIIRAASLTAAQTGAASPVTIPITLAAIGGAAAIAGTLFTPPGFAEGTEKVMGGGSETSDSVPALLSRGERVVTARKNREYWDSLSAIHNGTIPARELNDFVNNYTFERKPFTNTIVPVPTNNNSKELKEIADILKRQRGATFNIDENGIYAVVDRIRTRNNRIRKYLA